MNKKLKKKVAKLISNAVLKEQIKEGKTIMEIAFHHGLSEPRLHRYMAGEVPPRSMKEVFNLFDLDLNEISEEIK